MLGLQARARGHCCWVQGGSHPCSSPCLTSSVRKARPIGSLDILSLTHLVMPRKGWVNPSWSVSLSQPSVRFMVWSKAQLPSGDLTSASASVLQVVHL